MRQDEKLIEKKERLYLLGMRELGFVCLLLRKNQIVNSDLTK